jgi:hypothetical protein
MRPSWTQLLKKIMDGVWRASRFHVGAATVSDVYGHPIKLILQHGLMSHLYADDTQIDGGCRLSDFESFSRKVLVCVAEVAAWMRCSRLQLNVDNTELI